MMEFTQRNNTGREWTTETLAKTIGWGLIIMGVLAFVAEFKVRTQMINWEDPVATFRTIQDSLPLFRWGILSWLGVVFLDVVIALALLTLLYRVNKTSALLMGSLRLIYATIKGASLVGLFLAHDIYATATDETMAEQAQQYLRWHHHGFNVALFFFGLHLVFLAVLLFKARLTPKLINGLLLVGGVGYSVNSIVPLVAGDVEIVQQVVIAVFILPMSVAELTLGGWLLAKRKKLAAAPVLA